MEEADLRSLHREVMSQNEQICVQLTVLQQPNDSQERQSPKLQSTASSTRGDANGQCGSRYSVGVLKSAKIYLYHHKQWTEVALLSIAIVVILMLLLLPTIFYHLPLTLVSISICLLVIFNANLGYSHDRGLS